jgi:hypothetical protein
MPLGHTWAIIDYRHPDGLLIESRRDLDSPAPARRDRMVHGVLHERLKRERRNERIERVPVRIDTHVQSVTKTKPLDREVVSNEVQLLPESDFRSPPMIQRSPQKITKFPDHFVGRRGIDIHQ